MEKRNEAQPHRYQRILRRRRLEDGQDAEDGEDAEDAIEAFDVASHTLEVSSNAVKLTRRATSPDEIKWPQECSLLEFTKTPTSLLDALELCYQQYVKRGGPKAVNISEQMIAEIATQRDEKTWTSETFVKAQEEVYFIMARDVHPRFVNSKIFSNLVQCLGGFPYD